MRRKDRADLTERAALRLEQLLPVAAGWVPPVEPEPVDAVRGSDVAGQSWSASGLAPDDAVPAGWTDRVRLPFGRPAAVGLVVVALVGAAVTGSVVLRSRPHAVTAPVLERAGAASASASPGQEVVVSVVGKVRHPGLVRLVAGARVDDAIRAAGGATAGLGMLNVARKVTDGEQVVVGLPPSAAAGGSTAPGDGRLDLNAASAAELDGLPGIGPVLAQRIVDWRTEHGRFASVDQLREVPGIGESKYVSIKPKVLV